MVSKVPKKIVHANSFQIHVLFYKNTAYKNVRLKVEKLRTFQEQQGIKKVNLKNIV